MKCLVVQEIILEARWHQAEPFACLVLVQTHVAIAKQNATKRNFLDWHRTYDFVMPFGARIRKELIKLPKVVFDELPNRLEGVVLSVKLVLVGVTFSSAMSTPDMCIWNIYAITKRKVLHRIRVNTARRRA